MHEVGYINVVLT